MDQFTRTYKPAGPAFLPRPADCRQCGQRGPAPGGRCTTCGLPAPAAPAAAPAPAAPPAGDAPPRPRRRGA